MIFKKLKSTLNIAVICLKISFQMRIQKKRVFSIVDFSNEIPWQSNRVCGGSLAIEVGRLAIDDPAAAIQVSLGLIYGSVR